MIERLLAWFQWGRKSEQPKGFFQWWFWVDRWLLWYKNWRHAQVTSEHHRCQVESASDTIKLSSAIRAAEVESSATLTEVIGYGNGYLVNNFFGQIYSQAQISSIGLDVPINAIIMSSAKNGLILIACDSIQTEAAVDNLLFID